MVFEQDADLSPGETRNYTLGLVSSTVGNNDPADLIVTTKKAWRYAFGWQDMPATFFVPAEETEQPHSVPYRALGVHEDGVGSGCCGCIVAKVSGDDALTITPGPNACEGTIDVAGACCNLYPLTAVFRVTDLCGAYEDLLAVTIATNASCACWCPFQGDYDAA